MAASITRLIELNNIACRQGSEYPKKRALFNDITRDESKTFLGIIGPRGVGKTVLLQQMASENKAWFYLSCDTLDRADDIFGLASKLNKDYGIEHLLLDEVHYLQDLSGSLKRMYDFLQIKVVFTSSVAMSLAESAKDLCRRARIFKLNPFSFREYMWFKMDMELDCLSFRDLLEKTWSREHMLCEPYFEDFLKGGLMPMSLADPDVLSLLQSVKQRIVMRDVPSVAKLTTQELETMDSMLAFIGRSEVDGINYSSLSRNLGITKYKAMQYVSLLEQAFILVKVMPAGTNVLREPKILFAVPYRLLYKEFHEALGGLREDFVVQMLLGAGLKHWYLKSTRGAKVPDFMVQVDGRKMVLEVGGKGKGRSQFKGIEKVDDKIILSHSNRTDGNRRPLFMLGFLA